MEVVGSAVDSEEKVPNILSRRVTTSTTFPYERAVGTPPDSHGVMSASSPHTQCPNGCLPSHTYPLPLVHSHLFGSIASPLFPEMRGPTSLQVLVPPRLPCVPTTQAAMLPPASQGACELASFQVAHPSAPACLNRPFIRVSHARSISESLSPSLGTYLRRLNFQMGATSASATSVNASM